MLSYILKRLLVAIPTMFVIVAMAFFMMRAAPGGPFASERQLPPEIERNILAYYGMDKPLPEQFLNYVGNALQGDFGPSLKYKDKTVSDLIIEGLPVSAVVGLSSLALAIMIGVTLGCMAALRQNRSQDYVVMAFAMAGICIPPFVMGPILSLVFGVQLGWLPSAGLDAGEMTLDTLILPVITLALPQIAIISRLVRASMIEVMRSNWVRTAKAKGLTGTEVIIGHALRAGLLPLVSYLGPACAGLITGSVVIETVFQLPGIGRSFVTGALQRDYTVVMGVVILYAGLIILLNLVADLIYGLLDPKVKYE